MMERDSTPALRAVRVEPESRSEAETRRGEAMHNAAQGNALVFTHIFPRILGCGQSRLLVPKGHRRVAGGEAQRSPRIADPKHPSPDGASEALLRPFRAWLCYCDLFRGLRPCGPPPPATVRRPFGPEKQRGALQYRPGTKVVGKDKGNALGNGVPTTSQALKGRDGLGLYRPFRAWRV